MKILLPILFFVSSQVLLSQNIEELEFPRTIKPEISEAILKHLHSKDNESLKKIDSLKVIERQSLKENIIGTWEYFESKCSCCVKVKGAKAKYAKKIIKITEDNIFFYDDKISEKNLTQTEKIEFTNQYGFFSDLTDIVYEDKNIWDYKLDKTGNFLKVYHSGNETDKGRTSKISGIVTNYYKRIE